MPVTGLGANMLCNKKKLRKTIYSIQSVEHALDILEQFLESDDEFGLTDLCRRLKIQKNSVFRLLSTLVSRQFIEQDKITGKYRLGLKNLELGQTVVKHTSLYRSSKPIMKRLVRKCNETSELSILRRGQTIVIDAVESDNIVRVVPRVGIYLPADCTAAGKVILANTDGKGADLAFFNEEFKQFNNKPLTDLNEFEKKLIEIVNQGVAIEDEEHNSEVRSVAAPIYDYTRCVVGAISLSGPTIRFSKARIDDELVPLVKSAAGEISGKLGYL